jgi:hypothetical protein
MSTLADSAARAALLERLARLTPQSPRQWGRMSPHGAVCHLSDGMRMAWGIREGTRVDNPISRTLIRWVAIHSPMPWPHGVKTVPSADQEQGGTKPAEWDRDLAELTRLIRDFQAVDARRHPIFGPLNAREWNIWAWRHADHHLRQFNC